MKQLAAILLCLTLLAPPGGVVCSHFHFHTHLPTGAPDSHEVSHSDSSQALIGSSHLSPANPAQKPSPHRQPCHACSCSSHVQNAAQPHRITIPAFSPAAQPILEPTFVARDGFLQSVFRPPIV